MTDAPIYLVYFTQPPGVIPMGQLADCLRDIIQLQKEQDEKLMADLDNILKTADKLSVIAGEMSEAAQGLADLEE